jgi:hypothetical protein
MERCLVIDTRNPQYDRYRVALMEPSTRLIATAAVKPLRILPRISILRWTRVAEQVQSTLKQLYGLNVIVLDVLVDDPSRSDLVVAAIHSSVSTNSLPHFLSWGYLENVYKDELSSSERSDLERLVNKGATGRGPFSRFGWEEEALSWVSEEVKIQRSEFTGEMKQFNAKADFALARFARRNAPPLWLKASADTVLPEYRITTTLASIIPDSVPPLLAFREDWQAWWMADAGRSLEEDLSDDQLDRAIVGLAEIQMATIGHVSTLLANGCSDQRLPTIRKKIPAMIACIDKAMSSPNQSSLSRLRPSRIHEVGSALERACLGLEALEIPDTLTHGDMNLGNILVEGERCVFTDWAQGAVGNPLVTLERFLSQITQYPAVRSLTPTLTNVFRRSWLALLNESQINGALHFVPLIAPALDLCGRSDLLSEDRIHQPEFHGYVRVLARNMDRATRDLEMKEIRCA